MISWKSGFYRTLILGASDYNSLEGKYANKFEYHPQQAPNSCEFFFHTFTSHKIKCKCVILCEPFTKYKDKMYVN